jgi:hypothetical protein
LIGTRPIASVSGLRFGVVRGVWLVVVAAAAVAVLVTPGASTAGGCKKVPNLVNLPIAKAMTKAEDAGCGVPVDQPWWTGDNKTVRGCGRVSKPGDVTMQVPFAGKALKGGRIVLTTCPFVARGKPKVHVVYAVPAGQTWNQDDVTAIGGALSSLQGWYLSQVGKTFSYTPTLLCQLPYPAGEYRSNTWDKLLADIQPCANVTFSSQHADWVVYADVNHTCNKPGSIGEGEAGLTFLGVQDLNGLIGQPVSECGQNFDYPPSRYIGGLGHEMGHTFGLPHPPGCDQGQPSCDTNALMWLGYVSYPNTYLRPDEIKPLLKSPYFWKTTADGH